MICLLSGRYIIKDGKNLSYEQFFDELKMTNKVCLELDSRFVSNQSYNNYVHLYVNILTRLNKLVYLITPSKIIRVHKPVGRGIEQHDSTVSIDLGTSVTGLYFASNGTSKTIKTQDILKVIDEYKNVVIGKFNGRRDSFMFCFNRIIVLYMRYTGKRYYFVNESFTTIQANRHHDASKKQRDEIAAYLIYKRWLYTQIKLA